ncbi:MAG: GNAT family N-acetyltransferase [Candidatus ainarchaeum sp.]|nr:GNAT family N-acetyltransferase [Candidatus ainarchaeum sp.]MDD5639735.1 GNAT family N-acetyltransferase [Candidatus Paceibacterota bacterium]
MKISLRELNEFDIENFLLWMKDESVLRLAIGNAEEFLEQDIKKCFSKMVNSKKDEHYAILLSEKPIGLISLIKDRENNHKMQLLIGDKGYWSKGYDMEAVKQMVEKIKERKDLQVYIEVRPDKTGSIAAFANYGFVPTKNKKYPKDGHFPRALKMELS